MKSQKEIKLHYFQTLIKASPDLAYSLSERITVAIFESACEAGVIEGLSEGSESGFNLAIHSSVLQSFHKLLDMESEPHDFDEYISIYDKRLAENGLMPKSACEQIINQANNIINRSDK